MFKGLEIPENKDEVTINMQNICMQLQQLGTNKISQSNFDKKV